MNTGRFSRALPLLYTMKKKTHLCCFTDTISLLKVTTSRCANLIRCWVCSRPSECRALARQLVVEVSFCTEGHCGVTLDFRTDQIPNTLTRWLEPCRWKVHRPVATPFTRDPGKGQANTLSVLSSTEKAVYMSGSNLLQYIALDTMDVVFPTKEETSRTEKADVSGLLLLKRVTRYLVGQQEIATKQRSYQSNPAE